MNDTSIFSILATLAWFIYKFVMARRRRQEALRLSTSNEAGASKSSPSGRRVDDGAAQDFVDGVMHADAEAEAGADADASARNAQRLEALERIGEAMRRAEDLQRRIKHGPSSSSVLGEVLRDRVVPVVSSLQELPAGAWDGSVCQQVDLALMRVGVHLDVLEQIFEWRTSPKYRAHLADADALAAALWAPVENLARSEGLPILAERPICVPAVQNGEAIVLGLLPRGYPVIFVPPDFSASIFRWGSVAHEIGHLIWRTVPGFAEEVTARVGGAASSRLIRSDGDLAQGLQRMFGLWTEELVADCLTVMMLGPAGLRSLVESFQSPEEVDRVLWVYADSEGRYDEHPPAHLRVHLAAAMLDRMGYDVEAKALCAAWDKRHAHPEHLYFPAYPENFALRVEVVESFGRTWIADFYEGGYVSLGGRELRSVQGLELTPGLWAQVGRATAEMLDGHAVRYDPRVCIAAAIESSALSPARATRVARAVVRSILGRDADERKPNDPHFDRDEDPGGDALDRDRRVHGSRTRPWRGLTAADVRGAVILRTLLDRRPSGPS
ncbi:MAG: hypothetical protein H6729_13525 [Deltaproteobacteria bacterium]|nr:hypothetical protein [Deltaproteobacteria bacterium]